MSSHPSDLPSINRIQQRAKALKKKEGISQAQAYQKISEEYGFTSWPKFREELKKKERSKTTIQLPSIDFVMDEDVEMTEQDFESLDNERSSELPEDIKRRVQENKRQLTKVGIEFSVFEPTITGLNKSIIDATQPVRTHFELENFHFYSDQGQGQEHKVKKTSFLLTDKIKIKSSASFYRPNTKKGDPRMWFSKLSQICDAGDQIAIVIHEDSPFLINLSKTMLSESLENIDSCIGRFLNDVCEDEFSVAEELLSKLKGLAKQPLPALRSGSTGIGFTIETMLGIAANSSKEPDYDGIEIKSGRGATTRTTLFAQVPDWAKSPCKKSAEILNKYGYEREEDFKLYCTLSTLKENSQGLSFIYDESKDELQEWHNKTDLVAVWPGKLLRSRLTEKHAETFWIEASSEVIEGVEHFHLKSVTHTKRPMVSQLLPLIQSGVITMDHLIKRKGKTNRVSEKGPLFKMNKRDLELLFPAPKTYSLV
ncbi:MvaI/BcnI family restriction endonuclease [Paraglaciecola hydrolytica]|uniref:MvaI/BcnI restriction endonuclease domain-containing protein n=1 Tax=Paraglaciecola hydrolytica TaxID=1799789 RepID=A0A148KKF3_9ALTE|nr:MvaI/BcnI family restriction endonuclease [Paraglaciecola hydrolytica]KXI26776.1 hypothetical protein AX660_03130 [Paraglaciecola hydrolytica]